MDWQRLRLFDSMIIRYAARCKEIWIYEKYRREKSMKKSESFRTTYYAGLCKEVNDLVMELETTDFVDSELLECREQYLNAGRALGKAFECQMRGDPPDEPMKEYLYCMDNGAAELTRLWKDYGKTERRNKN